MKVLINSIFSSSSFGRSFLSSNKLLNNKKNTLRDIFKFYNKKKKTLLGL